MFYVLVFLWMNVTIAIVLSYFGWKVYVSQHSIMSQKNVYFSTCWKTRRLKFAILTDEISWQEVLLYVNGFNIVLHPLYIKTYYNLQVVRHPALIFFLQLTVFYCQEKSLTWVLFSRQRSSVDVGTKLQHCMEAYHNLEAAGLGKLIMQDSQRGTSAVSTSHYSNVCTHYNMITMQPQSCKEFTPHSYDIIMAP